jgi:hypothetical protein
MACSPHHDSASRQSSPTGAYLPTGISLALALGRSLGSGVPPILSSTPHPRALPLPQQQLRPSRACGTGLSRSRTSGRTRRRVPGGRAGKRAAPDPAASPACRAGRGGTNGRLQEVSVPRQSHRPCRGSRHRCRVQHGDSSIPIKAKRCMYCAPRKCPRSRRPSWSRPISPPPQPGDHVYGVVRARQAKPSRSRIGLLSGEASTCKYLYPRATAS